MSRIYDALKRAEAQRASAEDRRDGPARRPYAGRAADAEPLDSRDDVRLEYERLQMWITNGAPDATPMQAVMIASCGRGNGATTTAAGLAATLARQHAARVLIVDANLRTPCLHAVFGARPQPGFTQLLGNGSVSTDYIQPTAQANLFVMTSGLSSATQPELFSPAAFARLVADLKSRFDHIVFDTSPLLQFPDAYGMAPHVDGVLVVVEADRTLVDDARRVMRELERSRVRAAGVILNRQRDYTPRLLRRMLPRADGARMSP